MDRQYTYREGMTVYGADGDKVGKVVAVDPSYVVVEKGFFFPTDYYIPTSAVASMDDDNIYLTVSKDEALNQGWDQPMAETATTGYATDTTVGEPFDASRATATTDAYGSAATTEVDSQPFGHAQDTQRTHVQDQDRIAVPVYEEELVASKRERDAGAVRIEKDVVTEERTIDVPITEERVRVSQVTVDRDAPVDDTAAFQEGTIEVPLRTQEVELEKRTRVAGEVVVEKEDVQRTERVGGTVRREEVRVDDSTVSTIDGDTTIDRNRA